MTLKAAKLTYSWCFGALQCAKDVVLLVDLLALAAAVRPQRAVSFLKHS